MRRHIGDVGAVEHHLARGGLVEAGQHVQRRGLAGAVRPDQRVNAAAPHFDIDIIDRLEAAEIFGEAFDLEHHVAADGRGLEQQRQTRGMHPGLGAPALGGDIDKTPDAVGHVADDQNDRQSVDRQIKSGNAFEKPQPFRDQDQQSRADRRTDRRRHAAEQRHRQEHHRLGKRELIRTDISKAAGEQSAGQSAQHGAQSRKPKPWCGTRRCRPRRRQARCRAPRAWRGRAACPTDARRDSRPAPACRRRTPDMPARTETDSGRPIFETPSGPWVSQMVLIMTSVTICWNEIVTIAR